MDKKKIEIELEKNIKGVVSFKNEDESYFYFFSGYEDIRVGKKNLSCYYRRLNGVNWNYLFELDKDAIS